MSAAEKYLLSVVRGRRGLLPGTLRVALSALAPVYVAGLKTYLLPYQLGIRKRKRLPCPVVCIGNLTTGGTGKTPLTQTLCRALREAGLQVAILSRGYGGTYERGCAVASDEAAVLLNAREAGDEAFLLAKTLPGIPVIVGKDRRVTGMLAWDRFHPDVIVLDDGMQFWQLHRDLDIVVINACDPFDNGRTFPRGLLREPISHLRRAGTIVLTNVRRAALKQTETLKCTAARIAPGCPVFTADLTPVGLIPVGNADTRPIEWLDGRRVAALSAIGNPSSFESMIGDLGGVLAARFRFRDHEAISPTELERVYSQSRVAGAEAVITTEKDAVKLPPIEGGLPTIALRVSMQVGGETDFIATILAKLQSSSRDKRADVITDAPFSCGAGDEDARRLEGGVTP